MKKGTAIMTLAEAARVLGKEARWLRKRVLARERSLGRRILIRSNSGGKRVTYDVTLAMLRKEMPELFEVATSERDAFRSAIAEFAREIRELRERVDETNVKVGVLAEAQRRATGRH